MDKTVELMNRFPLYLLSVALFFVGCVSSTQTAAPDEAETPAAVRPDVDVRALEYPPLGDIPFPEIRRFELDNGLSVFLAEDPGLPSIQARARVNAGGLWDPAEKVGLAEIGAETMRTGGAGNRSPDELNEALENVGATVETSAGDKTVSATMFSLSEHIDTVLPLFASVVRDPQFDEEKVDLAKNQTKSGISRRNDNPQQIAFREVSKKIYGEESPWARTTEYWTIDAISREDLVAWHEEYFVPNNSMIAVWGDFNAATMETRIREAFGDWEVAPSFTEPELPPVAPDLGREVYFIAKDDVNQSTVLAGHVGEITLDDPNYPAVVVMNEILGGGFSSRLFQTVRTDLGYAYSVFGSYNADYKVPGLFFSGTFTKSGSTIAATEALLGVIESMKTDPPSEEELALAKDSYLNSFVFNFDTKGEVLNRVMNYAANDYPDHFLQSLQENIKAVTAEDVQRVAQEYLHPDQARILVLGKAEDFDQPVTALSPEVEEIDITIPLVKPGMEADIVQGDDDRATILLAKVLEAHGGAAALSAIETLRMSSASTVSTPQGEVEIESSSVVAIPDRMRITQTLPQGEMTFILDGDEARALTPAGVQEVPASAAGQIKMQMYLSLPYLLTRLATDHKAAPEVQSLSPVDGKDVLQVSGGGLQQPLRLILNSDGAVERLESTQMGQGGPVSYSIHLEEYADVDGMWFPMRYEEFAGTEASGVTTIQTIEINPEIDQAAFAE